MPLTIALISETFATVGGEGRLLARLREAKQAGAELVVLPEIPLNPWSPATTRALEDDAEEPGGRRHRAMAAAARDAGVGLVGGAIVRRGSTRHNTALVFDARGEHLASYAKVHLPDEPGFHEPCHYEPGTVMAEPVTGFGVPFGIQICSDINRPVGSHALAAAGAMAILNPRATEVATFERWKLVFRSTALTTCAYVLSVNRPAPEQEVPLGGPSIVVDPNGEVLLETTDPLAVVTIDEQVVADARTRYPGYLAIPSSLYATAWSRLQGQRTNA
ncbi:MAG TPA: carbon-nitrogen hydrolase family protein [Vicinamibacterales bacterium]|nr:carbon-nitrogen hydrolase family protein [Vicinamibacterales bacterium]